MASFTAGDGVRYDAVPLRLANTSSPSLILMRDALPTCREMF